MISNSFWLCKKCITADHHWGKEKSLTTFLITSEQHWMNRRLMLYVTGISYLSREQEDLAKVWKGIPVRGKYLEKSSSSPSVADTVFLERIRSRIKQWKNSFEDSSTRNDGKHILAVDSFAFWCYLLVFLWLISFYWSCTEPLIKSMRKLILGSEEYGSRPSITIDVCSQRQVQLALEVLFSEIT